MIFETIPAVRRTGLGLLAAVALALLLPSAAAAHAVPGIDYRFPLPVWLYGLAAGLAVLLSAPAATFALQASGTRTSRDLYGPLRRMRLGWVGVAIASFLLVDVVAGGLFGPNDFFENPATIVMWVDFWVGLGIVSALLGNVWDFVSPLNAAGRLLDRILAARGSAAMPYPKRLGLWPATALLLVWSWMELVWKQGKEPRVLVLILLAYVGVQLVAMAAYGTETWLARGELFTVVARTFARFAPLELYVREPAGECRTGLCVGAERPGCPACWLDAPREARGIRLRPYGAGVRREAPLGPGGGTFVLALLATVVYDGFSQTNQYARFQGYFLDRSTWLATHEKLLDTLLMAGIVAAFALAFLAVVTIVSRLERAPLADAARRYAPTLIPIAAVYFVSHYFLFLIYGGQFTYAAVFDPFGREWVPDVESPWKGVPGALVWYLQVGLIVWGHVVAVFEAHRVSLRVHGAPRRAAFAQSPLVLLMVGYTFTGLWVLGQVLAPP
jgi:hypothetical protein